MHTIRTPEKRELFLGALCGGATVAKAAGMAGFSRRAAYTWREEDPEFAQAWDDAIEIGTDTLEDEAIRRARDGVEKGIYHQGMRVDTVLEYSDTLLIFMLKARRPDKFKDRTEVTGKDGAPVVPVLNVTVGGN